MPQFVSGLGFWGENSAEIENGKRAMSLGGMYQNDDYFF